MDARPDGPDGPEPTELSRSDMALAREALRNDWPIPPAVRAQLLQRLVDYCDRESEDGEKASPRTVLAAARTIAEFARLTLGQQALDLRREEAQGRRQDQGATVADAMKLVDQVEKAMGQGEG